VNRSNSLLLWLASLAFLVSGAGIARADDGLNLVPVPGPGGVTPFKSPGGHGPIGLVSPPGDVSAERVFVLTQDGYIYVIDRGVLQPTPFLDLHAKTDTFNENGLFSMAFAPDYATSGQFYVNYSDLSGGANPNLDRHTVVGYQRSADNPDRADATPTGTVLVVPSTGCGPGTAQPMTSPHYGGQMAFGPDGHLWVPVGDGGDGSCASTNGGPVQNSTLALNLNDLHGKMLRIDPIPSGSYAVPADNPLVARAAASHDVLPEIWAYGLRNPWRISFDAAAPNDLWIADVGESTWEELDHVPSATSGTAAFFGWPCVECTKVWRAGAACQVTTGSGTGTATTAPASVAPAYTSSHLNASGGAQGCTAIIGGAVLHDASLPSAMSGRYLFSSFCGGGFGNGELLSGDSAATPFTVRDEHLTGSYGVGAVALDGCGHPYVLNVVAGGLSRLEGDTPGPCGEFLAPNTAVEATAPGATRSFTYTSTSRGTTFACTLDAAALSCPTSDLHETNGTVTVGPLGAGTHQLTVAAVDEAGNRDPTPASQSWTVAGPLVTQTSTTPAETVPAKSASDPVPAAPVLAEPPAPAKAPAAPPTPRLKTLGSLATLRLDHLGRVTVRLGGLPAGSKATVVLRHGIKPASRKLRLTGTGGQLTLRLRLTSQTRAQLKRHHTLSLVLDVRRSDGTARLRVKLRLRKPAG
jgi:glucose/arabinose dehydrogenase